MHSSSLIFNPGPGPQTLLKRNSLVDRILINIEILGDDRDLPFGLERAVKRIGWHPRFFNYRAAKRILWIKHNARKFSNRMPAVRQVISIKNAIKQGCLNYCAHFEIIIHQVENFPFFIGLTISMNIFFPSVRKRLFVANGWSVR